MFLSLSLLGLRYCLRILLNLASSQEPNLNCYFLTFDVSIAYVSSSILFRTLSESRKSYWSTDLLPPHSLFKDHTYDNKYIEYLFE